jgi:hypothetical protein
MLTFFNRSSQHSARAVQAYQILVGMAMRRQTTTYEGLSLLMYKKKAQGVLNKILGHIAFYCSDNKLPILTDIVVGKGRGTPGHNIPLSSSRFDKTREEIYRYDWYNVYPPSEAELETAFKNNS